MTSGSFSSVRFRCERTVTEGGAGRYGKMYYHDNYGEFYMMSINITICLFIQNTIPNSLTEGHYIDVFGSLKYGIRLKSVFFSQ